MKSVTLLGKEIPTAVLALVLVLAGVGATAGAAASGDIAGDGTTNVDQALLLNSSNDAVDLDDDGTAQIADDRTAFTFGTQVFQGSSQTVNVSVDNEASDEIDARLVADTEEPLRISVDSSDSDSLEVTRVSPNEFIVTAAGNVEDDEFQITVHAPNDANPDFYEFEFRLEPVDVSDEVRSDQ